jgi:hypothetical protein
MMRDSPVPDSNPRPIRDPPPEHSLAVKPIRASLKFLAAYGVAFVNAAALLYILVRLALAGIHRFLEAI